MKSLKRFLFVSALALSLIGNSFADTKHYLSIGDPAPTLNSATWIKGTGQSTFKAGNVYVVEFWATWCTPCKENIPHLTDLSHKYRGKAVVDGISIWEALSAGDSSSSKKVRSFVQSEGLKMDYNVAFDDAKNRVATSWMTAAGESAIPTAFVVGRDGKIAWIGHPEGLEPVLQKVLDDKWDIKAAEDRRNLEKEVIRPIEEAVAAKKFPEALKAIDAAVAKRPNLDRAYEYDRLIALDHISLDEGIARSKKIIADSNQDIGAYRMIVSIFATQTDLAPKAYEFGAELAKDAIAKNEMKYLFLSMLAEIYLHENKPKEAVDFGSQAIETAKVDTHCPPQFLQFLKSNQAKYEAKDKEIGK